ncbi:MAG: aminotransferase class III-fold pyridoxal phosphate-dependent enzyme [Chlamydiales bacterium]
MRSQLEHSLVAKTLQNDPSFIKAKEQILAAVKKHSQSIQAIRPPKSDLVQSYEKTIKQFEKYRSIPLFYPYLGSGIGNGALVELADGSVKYDFISGIGAHFGHSHPMLISAAIDAAIQDIAVEGNLQQNVDGFKLTEKLIEASGLDHCFLTNSGAMANENALKLIFQKKAPAHRLLAFDRCFMGRTLALSQITDRPAFREGLPHNILVDYVPFYNWQQPKKSTESAIAALEKLLKRYPNQYGAMCFEMIQGEAGFYPGKHEFFMALIQILKAHNVAVLVDEVQTFGRTDHLFAFQSFGLQGRVDIVTLGKLMNTCATLFTREFRPKAGLISQTFTAATSSIRCSTAIIDSLLNEDYLGHEGKNMKLRKHFVNHLLRLANTFPDRFEGPFGHGLMIGCTPFKGDREKVLAFCRALFAEGVITFAAGTFPTRLRFLVPAGGVRFEDIDEVVRILERLLSKL